MDIENYYVWYQNAMLTNLLLLLLLLTENGTFENGIFKNDHNLQAAKDNKGRQQYFKGYIKAYKKAKDIIGVSLKIYFTWSIMENFEFGYGYIKKI